MSVTMTESSATAVELRRALSPTKYDFEIHIGSALCRQSTKNVLVDEPSKRKSLQRVDPLITSDKSSLSSVIIINGNRFVVKQLPQDASESLLVAIFVPLNFLTQKSPTNDEGKPQGKGNSKRNDTSYHNQILSTSSSGSSVPRQELEITEDGESILNDCKKEDDICAASSNVRADSIKLHTLINDVNISETRSHGAGNMRSGITQNFTDTTIESVGSSKHTTMLEATNHISDVCRFIKERDKSPTVAYYADVCDINRIVMNRQKIASSDTHDEACANVERGLDMNANISRDSGNDLDDGVSGCLEQENGNAISKGESLADGAGGCLEQENVNAISTDESNLVCDTTHSLPKYLDENDSADVEDVFNNSEGVFDGDTGRRGSKLDNGNETLIEEDTIGSSCLTSPYTDSSLTKGVCILETVIHCDVCDKDCNTLSSLKLHKHIHDSVRSFRCRLCGTRFEQVELYEKHIKKHEGRYVFQCSICGLSFNSKALLDRHVSKHSITEDEFKCKECGKSFKLRSSFTIHMKKHEKNKPYKCGWCDAGFIYQSTLQTHQKQSKTGLIPSCDLCNKSFPYRCQYLAHKAHHEKQRPWVCSICGKDFVTRKNLRRHEQQMHKDSNRKYCCSDCGRSFHRSNALYHHICVKAGDEEMSRLIEEHNKEVRGGLEKTNSNTLSESVKKKSLCNICGKELVWLGRRCVKCSNYLCDLCGKVCISYKGIKSHILTHTKYFSCNICGKCFGCKQYLKDHLVCHDATREKLPCRHCEKSFLTKKKLYMHEKQHTKERAFSCHLCAQRFVFKSELTNHLKINTMALSLRCCYCQKTFPYRCILRQHMKTHREELQYHACNICGKKYTQKFHLTYHMRLHTGEKPHKCPTCHTSFIRANYLMRHKCVGVVTDTSSETQTNVNSHSKTAKAIPVHDVLVMEDNLNLSTESRSRSEVKGTLDSTTVAEWESRDAYCTEPASSLNTGNTRDVSETNIEPGASRQIDSEKTKELGGVQIDSDIIPGLNADSITQESFDISGVSLVPVNISDIANLNSMVKEDFTVFQVLKYRCQKCNGRFPDSVSKLQHDCHPALPPRPYLEVPNNKKVGFICKHCGKHLSTKCALRNHIMMHLGWKPFLCDLCGKRFIRKNHLVDHIKVHVCNKVKKSVCMCHICGKEFSCQSTLNLHHRVHSDLRPFLCDICGRGFKYKQLMESHKVSHFEDRPYKCGVCGKGFKKQSVLNNHRRTHTGEKSFQCHKCDKSYVNSSSLYKHKIKQKC